MKSESQPQGKKNGRPSDYSDALADTICFQLAEGASLRNICADPAMPHISTVLRWAIKHEGFREQYAHAREIQSEVLVDEIIDISNNEWRIYEPDTIQTEKGDFPNKEWMQRSSLMIEARKWFAGKVQPKKYGTKSVDVTSGGDKLTGIQINDIGA